MKEAKKIVNNLKNNQIKPLYLLTGDEPFYIDFVSGYIEKNLLTDDEKAFNQMVLYGRDVSVEEIINHAKRYPMMAERQVIIIKEAQDLEKSIELLLPYAENPTPTTVLVLCYKYKSFDKRKKLFKIIEKNGEVLLTSTLYENKVAGWIEETLREHGYGIQPKGALMLVEFLGNDLSKIFKELEKLMQIVPANQVITPEIIEKNIGISKDYNNFELHNAIGSRDIKRVFRIVQYFSNNPKENPIPMIVALLFSFFQKIMKYHSLTDTSKAVQALGISTFYLKDYQLAAKNFPPKKVSSIIEKLREIDMMSKGLGATNLPQGELLKELMTEIMK